MRKAVLPTAALAGLLTLLSVTACGTEPAGTASPAVPIPSPTGSVSAGAPEPSPTVPAAPAGTQVEVTYADGEVTGDTGRVEVGVGEPVTLTVTSDVAEQIHVHGVDLYVDLEPGRASTTTFAQEAPGIYEIELHDAGRVLTRLQVS